MKLFLHIFYKFLILLHTENGRVKATLQILYSQYCIWDLFGIHLRFVCFRPRKNNQLCIQNHGQGIHSAKMGVVLRLKIPQFPQIIWIFEKKTLSIVRTIAHVEALQLLKNLSYPNPQCYRQ